MTIVTINSKGTTIICHMWENNKCAIKLGYYHVNQTITTTGVTTTNSSVTADLTISACHSQSVKGSP